MTAQSMRTQPSTDVLEIEEYSARIPWSPIAIGFGAGALIVLLMVMFASYVYIWNIISILVICTLLGMCWALYLYANKLREHNREQIDRAHQRMDDIRQKYDTVAPTTVLAPIAPPEFTDQLQEHRHIVLETVLAALKGGKTVFSQAQREQLEGMAHALLDTQRTDFKFTQQRAESSPPAGFQAQIMQNWTPVIQVVNTWASDPNNQWTYEELGVARAIAKEVTQQQVASVAAQKGVQP